ncbi:hypothetical protein BDN67DRAFT_985777 [Paxillus ammoniavirescens]|nr:hypothetical protein BDN67DRAFT_985777 [Paxillus ammoniavirescens]
MLCRFCVTLLQMVLTFGGDPLLLEQGVYGINARVICVLNRAFAICPFRRLATLIQFITRVKHMHNIVAGIGMVMEFIHLVPITHTLMSMDDLGFFPGSNFNTKASNTILQVNWPSGPVSFHIALKASFVWPSENIIVGAPIAGRLSDVMSKWGGGSVRERNTWSGDKLNTIIHQWLWSEPYFSPLSSYQLIIAQIDFVMKPLNAYTVDLVHLQGAEVMVVGGAFRSIIMATGIALVLPSIQHFGVLTTNIFMAFLMLAGQGCWLHNGQQPLIDIARV